MSPFRKEASCPSAGLLLDHQAGLLPPSQQHNIETHLAACEFCAAEAHFLGANPPGEIEAATVPPVPLAVYVFMRQVKPAQ